jgi:hypothetical protein
VQSRASSFKWQYPLLSLRSSNSFICLLLCLPVISIPPYILPSITHRRHFLCKMWPIQFAFHLHISCSIFLCSLTLSNTSSFLTWSVQLIFTIPLQHHTRCTCTEFNHHGEWDLCIPVILAEMVVYLLSSYFMHMSSWLRLFGFPSTLPAICYPNMVTQAIHIPLHMFPIKISVCWDIVLFSAAHRYLHFEGICHWLKNLGVYLPNSRAGRSSNFTHLSNLLVMVIISLAPMQSTRKYQSVS